MKLKIGYFYPEFLNLYGDNGNIEILKYRAAKRGIDVSVENISINTTLSSSAMQDLDIIFMGGGPDSSQKDMYEDLYHNKKDYIVDYVENGGVSLVVCASYQLFGHYYKSADGSILDGLGIFDLYTEHFGLKKPRCIGNIVCEIEPSLSKNTLFEKVNVIGNTLVGFENHGGRTYLGEGVKPFAKVVFGHGNNSEDLTEGVYYKNSIGTYFHGPILARNSHIADYLIAKSLNLDDLPKLDDSFILSAHDASLKLKQ